jgi:hypothetical protein
MTRALLRGIVCLTLLLTTNGCASIAAGIGRGILGAVVRGAVIGALSAARSPSRGHRYHHRAEPEEETECEQKLRMWLEVEQPPQGVEPPPELRCDPDGEYPSETEVAKNASPAPM